VPVDVTLTVPLPLTGALCEEGDAVRAVAAALAEDARGMPSVRADEATTRTPLAQRNAARALVGLLIMRVLSSDG
jgi:hypothetical protein